jgi:hypothetical protein
MNTVMNTASGTLQIDLIVAIVLYNLFDEYYYCQQPVRVLTKAFLFAPKKIHLFD